MTKKMVFLLLCIFLPRLFSDTITLAQKDSGINITPKLEIYLDTTRHKSFEEIKKVAHEFKAYERVFFDFGYIVTDALWVKAVFENSSSNRIKKIISYSDPLVSEFYMYEENRKSTRVQGVKFRPPNLVNLHHYFEIELPPYSVKTYYFQLQTHYSSTAGYFSVWSEKSFFDKERVHFLLVFSFFVAMGVLLLYNLFLYIFSRDKLYLFYAFYMFSITFMHSLTTGFLYTLIEPQLRVYLENDIAAMITFNIMILAAIPFQKAFLNLKQYHAVNTITNFLGIFLIFLTIFLCLPQFFYLLEYDIYYIYMYGIFALFTGVYAIYKKNRHGLYFTFGWGMTVLATLLMTLQLTGVYPVLIDYPYVIEILYVLEGFLFSFFLARRLKELEDDKLLLNQQLLLQQKNENVRLEKEVANKTEDLTKSLNIQANLLRELHHRVKNNMQVILSMIRIQYREIAEHDLREKFIEIENRIEAMSNVHELLYSEEVLDNDAIEYYFEGLIENIQNSFSDAYHVETTLNFEAEFKIEDLVYLGLIVNELVFNAYKYAFKDKKGHIMIQMGKENASFVLEVSDNGAGMGDTKRSNSLGLALVKTLVEKQLQGTLQIIFGAQGTRVRIVFS